jgi:hypothetical protein
MSSILVRRVRSAESPTFGRPLITPDQPSTDLVSLNDPPPDVPVLI